VVAAATEVMMLKTLVLVLILEEEEEEEEEVVLMMMLLGRVAAPDDLALFWAVSWLVLGVVELANAWQIRVEQTT
jgi:hypothetical protein